MTTVNNVVFPTGAIIEGKEIHIYYGAADSRIGIISFNLFELYKSLK